jgi:hypothetical protein
MRSECINVRVPPKLEKMVVFDRREAVVEDGDELD